MWTCKREQKKCLALTFTEVIFPNWQASCKERWQIFTSLSDCNSIENLQLKLIFELSKGKCTGNFPVFLESIRVHNREPLRFESFLKLELRIRIHIDFLLGYKLCAVHFRAQLARQQTRLQSTHPLPRKVKNRANLTSWQQKPYIWHFDKDVFSTCQGGKWTEYQMKHQKLTINSDKLLNWEQKTPASLQNSILSLGTEITHREIRVFNF